MSRPAPALFGRIGLLPLGVRLHALALIACGGAPAVLAIRAQLVGPGADWAARLGSEPLLASVLAAAVAAALTFAAEPPRGPLSSYPAQLRRRLVELTQQHVAAPSRQEKP